MKALRGTVAVVTGGASGIGLAMLEAFGAEGMKLVVADIEQMALDRAVAELQACGFEVVGFRCDVASYADMEALAAATMETFGKAHLVAHNAGVSISGPIWEMSLDDWRWVYDVNVWGVIHGIKAFTPLQLASGEPGHVVITASEAAILGIGHHAPYCSSKAAALSLGLSLHSELAAANSRIGVSVLLPGMVDTQIHRSWRNRPQEDRPWSERESADPAARARADAFQARGVTPQEIARLTLEAIREDRFYVFNTPHWRAMVAHVRDVALEEKTPTVQTWGPDLRPQPLKP